MPKSAFLGEWEQLVLLAILRENGTAKIPGLRTHLSSIVGRQVARGALYVTLDRLEDKGYIRWELDDATPGRGGHPSRRFTVTRTGRTALDASRKALQALWRDVDEVSR